MFVKTLISCIFGAIVVFEIVSATREYEEKASREFCDDEEVSVEYDSRSIECGDELPLSAVDSSKEPKVTVKSADEGTKYALVMFDPDAPGTNNPICKSWLLWLVGNIPGNDLQNGDISKGNIVTEYGTISPLKGSGRHHYRFLILNQNGQNLKRHPFSKRCAFNVQSFIDDNHLTVEFVNEFQVVNE